MKKSRKKLWLHVLFWLFIAAGALWIAYAPVPKHAPPASINVKVEQPVVETETAPVGDEKAESPPEQVASMTVPVVPKREDITPYKGNPRIAIVIDDVGLDMKGSQRAIDLPAYVTLSFMPYATRLKEQTRDARDKGHELMLHMPMEPIGHDDPGPGALLVNLSQDEIRQRFQNALASFVGFDGVNNHMGSKFTAYPEGMEIVVDELKQRHLFFLDSRTSGKTVGEDIARQHKLPTIARDVFLDDTITPQAIRAQLEQTEHVARRKGYAVAIGHPHAATMDVLAEWLPEAEKRGLTFVPVRELISLPPKN
jgi:polysaccharide deacetylase 2 family uncharacterized protein YibQ